MYLFFDAVSSHGYIGLYNENRQCIYCNSFDIKGNESSKLVPIIDEFIKEQDIAYEDLKSITTVIGPGSFTGIRSVSLIVNTLAFIYPQLYITAISFFDLYDSYPIVKSSSKRDLFVKYSENDTIEVVKNDDLTFGPDVISVSGDTEKERIGNEIQLENTPDYDAIFRRVVFQKNKQVAPLYIKKPNIS